MFESLLKKSKLTRILHMSVMGSALSLIHSFSYCDSSLAQGDPLILPAETPLAVMLKNQINFVPELKGQSLPLTGYLILPIHGPEGQLLAPKGTLVTLWLQPGEDSANLVADGLLLDSKLIPIKTVPLPLPAQYDDFAFESEYLPSPSRFNQVSTNLLGVVLDSDSIEPPIRAGLGFGLGVVAGISSPKAKRAPKIINIEGETVYVLMLESESQLPSEIDLERYMDILEEADD